MSTPSITAGQIVAALSALVTACVVLFKLDLTDAQIAAIIAAIGTVVPTAWVIGDSIIRHGRAGKAAAEANLAAAQIRSLSPDVPQIKP